MTFEHRELADLLEIASLAKADRSTDWRPKSIQMKDIGNGGAEGVRTLDPHVANVVLSQLSYRPM